MNGEPLFVLACSLLGITFGLFLGAALLRAAVALANYLVGKAKTHPPAAHLYDWDDWDGENDQWDKPERLRDTTAAIPEPGIGKAMLTLFLTFLTNFILLLILGFAVTEFMNVKIRREEHVLLLLLGESPVAFLTLTTLLTITLPTTFIRAALVTFLYGALLVASLIAIGGLLYGVVGMAQL